MTEFRVIWYRYLFPKFVEAEVIWIQTTIFLIKAQTTNDLIPTDSFLLFSKFSIIPLQKL